MSEEKSEFSFEDAMKLTRSVSSHTAFDEDECHRLWDLLRGVGAHGLVVEIGCQYGRSSSLILQAAREFKFMSVHIDPWWHREDVEWTKMAQPIQVEHIVLHMTSQAAIETCAPLFADGIDLLLIDGDHSEEGVGYDSSHYGFFVNAGGVMCAHDYGRDSLIAVQRTMDSYITRNQLVWEQIEGAGTLGVWLRKHVD